MIRDHFSIMYTMSLMPQLSSIFPQPALQYLDGGRTKLADGRDTHLLESLIGMGSYPGDLVDLERGEELLLHSRGDMKIPVRLCLVCSDLGHHLVRGKRKRD